MKYLLLFLSLITCAGNAQTIKIGRIRQLKPELAGNYQVAGISPDGKKILATGPGLKGLYLITVKNGKTQTITDLPGAGHHPTFSADGQAIRFQSEEFPNQRRITTIHRIDLSTGMIQTPVIDEKSSTQPALSTAIKPEGKGSRIWVSPSPDQTKTVYHLVGKGTFVCDSVGNILDSLGKMNAPKWLNNHMIIGMDDHDDGDIVTASELVIFDITSGEKVYLTHSTDRHEMYPIPFPDGKTIAFKTADSKLFTAKIKIRK